MPVLWDRKLINHKGTRALWNYKQKEAVSGIVSLNPGGSYQKWRGVMIARLWHGVTDASRADEYYQYLQRTGIPDYRKTEGNLGVSVLRRIENDEAHFLLITLWESEEAIKQFSGPDMEAARYYPEDEQFLHELEPNVTHYEVMARFP
jgi:heme-degrading monooxygenase HmoA